MNHIQKNCLQATLGISAALLLSACSATTDESGAANLNCSGKVIPGVEYRIERLQNTDDFELSCGAFRGDLAGPTRVQFRVVEVMKSNLPKGGGTSEVPAGLQENDEEDEILVPRAGIAFAPAIGSNLNMSALRTNPEWQVDPQKCAEVAATPSTDDDNQCVVSPFVYMGVVTPSAEWCSDSTGVITYEFWMTCNGSESKFNASVVAGAIQVTSTYGFDITN